MQNGLHAEHTVPIRSARNPIDAASARVSSYALCAAVGLDAGALQDCDGRLPMSQLLKLYETAARMTDDDAFGLHVATRIDLGSYGMLGYLLLNSATPVVAFERLARYFPIWSNAASFTLLREKGAAHVIWEYKDSCCAEFRHDCEMTLLSAARVGRLATGVEPLEVRFRHGAPRSTSEHKRLFRAPVYFRMECNEVIFDTAAITAPLRQADPRLGDLLVGYAEQLLTTARTAPAWIDRVRLALRRSVTGGNLGLAPLAREAGIGTRSLQRRLKEHDTSFRRLLTEVRQDLAKENLRRRELSITDIAYLLGYSHPSEFHRAFRRWTGICPGRYRLSDS